MTQGTIKEGDYHPSADSALRWLQSFQSTDFKGYCMATEAIASSALAGNRLAEICSGTLERLRKKEPISDRYLLGLAWALRELREQE